jgi:hypothetical protein
MDRSTRRPYLLFPKLGPAGSRGALPLGVAANLVPKTVASRRSSPKKAAPFSAVEAMYDPAELSRAGVTPGEWAPRLRNLVEVANYLLAEEFHSVKAFVISSHKDRVHRESSIKMQKLLVEVRHSRCVSAIFLLTHLKCRHDTIDDCTRCDELFTGGSPYAACA